MLSLLVAGLRSGEAGVEAELPVGIWVHPHGLEQRRLDRLVGIRGWAVVDGQHT